ncbi:MAG: hypothetical protein K1X57_09480 [Gemmataceae bacterium]|nr:hypothetical protein [Gemmataceae bacterium]
MQPIRAMWMACVIGAVLSAGLAGQDRAPAARGEVVTEMSKAIWYVFQCKNGDYWFGSDDSGVYRYDGKTLVHFTMKDGLCSHRIRGVQEDAAGNVYFTTYEGISKFDGRAFTTLKASAEVSPEGWKKQPGDLWFVGPPDAGVVFRYDGATLHRLAFPRTRLGDEHFVRMPRDTFPNAKYNPYDVYCILRDSRGDLWFGTTCVGVCRYDGKSFTWLTDSKLTEAPVRSIFEDSKGNFWFSYSGHASFEGTRPVRDFGRLLPGKEGRIIPAMSIVEAADGKLWLAELGTGAISYDGKLLVPYPIQDGLTKVRVFSITKDNHGTLWLGTLNGGAYKFNGRAFEPFRP